MDRRLPQIERLNEGSSCWTCLKRKVACDKRLPRTSHGFPDTHRSFCVGKDKCIDTQTDARTCVTDCKNCQESGLRCRGFGVRFVWPSDSSRAPQSKKKSPRRGHATPQSIEDEVHPDMPPSLSSLALPSEDSLFMQHYLRTCTRSVLQR